MIGRPGFGLFLSLLLSSCAWFVNLEGERELMQRGHDPVGYFTAGIAMPGRSEFRAEHGGVSYRFANETNRRLFITNPERYVPQFGGLCANGMVYALPTAAESDAFKIIDGRLYLFASRRARQYFEMDQERNLRLAWHYWDAEVRDSTFWWQSLKRNVFRVPHYKTTTELGSEYERRAARKTDELKGS
jgi:YHS domain-containing protein